MSKFEKKIGDMMSYCKTVYTKSGATMTMEEGVIQKFRTVKQVLVQPNNSKRPSWVDIDIISEVSK